MIEAKERQRNDAAVTTKKEERLPNQPIVETHPDLASASKRAQAFAPVFTKSEADQFRAYWLEVQSRFVDDPNLSVKQADELVTRLIKNITTNFADKRTSLEKRWKNGDQVSTEDLRVALKQYRSFLDQLLSLET